MTTGAHAYLMRDKNLVFKHEHTVTLEDRWRLDVIADSEHLVGLPVLFHSKYGSIFEPFGHSPPCHIRYALHA